MSIHPTALALFVAAAAFGQPAGSRPSFEVASVKPAPPITNKAEVRSGTQIDGAQVNIATASLADLVRQAYRLRSFQFAGPDWMSSERYDVHAKLPAGAAPGQVPEMLQMLLADRFKLAFHRESKEHQVYALTVVKSGLKMTEAKPDAAADPPRSPAKVVGGQLHLDQIMTMPEICDYFARFVDRPLVDGTGLTPSYRLVLDVPVLEFKKSAEAAAMARSGTVGDSASDPLNASVVVDWLHQLGLTLESRKSPVELLVVDRAEKVPVEN